VDSYEGAAVFYHLGELEAGDEIEVTRADGTVATFVVTEKERVPQDNFPTLDVYGPIDYAGLRLVTCTGVYDHGTLRYSHNLIVYAVLKESLQEGENETEVE
jgi:sortase (surface protein transpeptidase)